MAVGVWEEGRDAEHRPPEWQRYFDGALSNTLPLADCPNTITVSPFHGTMDICPPSMSASMHELNACNANFQICVDNFFLGFICFTPPNPEVGLAPAPSLESVRGLAEIKGPVSQTLCPRTFLIASGRVGYMS